MPMSFALSAALFLLRRSLSERVETEDASGAAGIEHGADGVVVTPERSGKPLLDSDAPRAQIFSGNRARLGEIRSACDQFSKQTCAVRRAERWRFRSGPRISGTLRQLPSLAGRSNLRDLAAVAGGSARAQRPTAPARFAAGRVGPISRSSRRSRCEDRPPVA